jgi:hypothetical protein
MEAPMKIPSVIATALLVCVLVVSCSHPTTTPPPNPSSFPFTVAATIDGSPYSAGATMTVNQIGTNYYVVLQSNGSANSGLTLTFILPTNSTFPKNLSLQQFNGSFSESSTTTWQINPDSAAAIKVNSFTYTYADTTFSADFAFKATGGVSGGLQSTKNIAAGTVRNN